MKKIAIVSDSTGCIPNNVLEDLNIFVNYLVIIFKDKSYREFKDVDSEKFVQLCSQQDELPTTSQPAPGQTIELYEKILAEGYDEIIHIAVSNKLSGSFQSAVNCADIVDAERITVIDAKTVAYPQGMMAVEAAKMVQNGATKEEILKAIEELKENSQLTAAIYDLTNLKKGGRLSNTQATIGSLLGIKPIVQIQPDGALEPVEKIRTFKKALNGLIERAKSANLTEDYEIGILHMANPEGAEILREAMVAAYPNLKIQLLPLSLVVAVHAGEGAVAVGWVKTK